MRVAPVGTVLRLVALAALSTTLGGCPEKGGAPADKTVAEPERAEPDDEGKSDEKAKRPAPAPAPAAAPPAADEKKEEAKDGKDEGGW